MKQTVTYRRAPGTPPTARQLRNLRELARMPDSAIDTSDIPVLPPSAWKHAVRGGLYRPVKKAVSIRLDADVILWLKKDGKGYQTRVNSLLRRQMLKDLAG
jgi:uncharacterized protein (DUF4415 family)